MEQTPHPHVALLPSPGMGHLIPFVEFAKQLLHHHDFSVTVIVATTGSLSTTQKEVLEALPKGIDYVLLPPVSFDDSVEAVTQIALTMTRSLPSVRDILKSLITSTTTRMVALVVDPMGTDAFDVAKELHILSYIFFPPSAMSLSWSFYLPKLDEMALEELPEPVKIPGCIPVHSRDLVDLGQDRKTEAYKWFLHHTKRFNLAEGIIVNSFMDLEPGAIKALQGEEPSKPPVYPVGPVIRTGSESGSECLRWLDSQPGDSVLFVSFGSGGTLSTDQLNELALGLEMSGQRFIWVVKSPNDRFTNATYFSVQSQSDPFGFLPKGFMERTKEQGLVVSPWAPQVEVLSHGSTGGFLTHCGWNSVLESVVHGVPLIAWPLYAEQKMNAVMLIEDLKVAMRPNANENGLVGREEIAQVVKGLMEGEEGKMLRNRMFDLKEAASKALSQDGSSTKSLSELVLKWKTHISI